MLFKLAMNTTNSICLYFWLNKNHVQLNLESVVFIASLYTKASATSGNVL